MKRILFALALAVVASEARADWGAAGPVMPQPMPGMQAPGGGNAYGVNPALKRLLWWKKDAGCNNCGNCGPGMGGPSGTLVYPQHPYARSPRDWFMYGY